MLSVLRAQILHCDLFQDPTSPIGKWEKLDDRSPWIWHVRYDAVMNQVRFCLFERSRVSYGTLVWY